VTVSDATTTAQSIFGVSFTQPTAMPTSDVQSTTSYSGLYYEDDAVRLQSAGSFKITVSSGGKYSGTLQMAAGIELKRAGRFLSVMDTLVTLAPLLGLLGTVTGLMRAFLSIGSAELSVVAVTGGIGEALIATACGLGIAIVSLIPYNYFSGRVTQLQFDLETAATNIEVMVGSGKAGETAASPPTQSPRSGNH